MGGTGGTYNLAGGGDTTSSSPVSQDGFLGSRAALPAASTTTPTSEADFSTWLASIQQAAQGIPTASTTDAGNPLIANPTTAAGFAHADYPVAAAAEVGHLGAAAPVAPAVDTTPKEFAAPTSFRPIWDVASEVNDALSQKYAWDHTVGWQNDPVRAREWLQMIADKGGDWRDSTTGVKPGYGYGYNIAAPAGMGQIYWPGDPARPK